MIHHAYCCSSRKSIPNQVTARRIAAIEISQNAVLHRVTRALVHAQGTVVYGWDQQKDFKTFLVNQLTDLMEGLTNPAVIQESERVRALHKKYNQPYMRRPRYSCGTAGNALLICKMYVNGAQCRVCCLSSLKKDRSVYSMKPKTCADNLHALDSYELHDRVVALRQVTLCSSVLAVKHDVGPATNQCLSPREHFLL